MDSETLNVELYRLLTFRKKGHYIVVFPQTACNETPFYDVSTEKQYDSNRIINKANCLHFAKITNAHFCKNGLK